MLSTFWQMTSLTSQGSKSASLEKDSSRSKHPVWMKKTRLWTLVRSHDSNSFNTNPTRQRTRTLTILTLHTLTPTSTLIHHSSPSWKTWSSMLGSAASPSQTLSCLEQWILSISSYPKRTSRATRCRSSLTCQCSWVPTLRAWLIATSSTMTCLTATHRRIGYTWSKAIRWTG